MFSGVISSFNRRHAKVPAAGGFFRLLRLVAAAGLVTRIRSLSSVGGVTAYVACARAKTVAFFGSVIRFLLTALCLHCSIALAATPPNTPITNIASASYSVAGVPVPVSVNGSVTVLTSSRTPATIEFLQLLSSSQGLPAGAASNQNVLPSQCDAGAGFTPVPTLTLPGGSSMKVPGNYLLASTSFYADGDVVLVRVTDFDQNINPLLAESVVVRVSSNNVDFETLRLSETGVSTGIFIGYLPAVSGAAQPGNCRLDVGPNHRLLATYIDQSEGSVAITAEALINPLGLVFDSATGLSVTGAQVTLIDAATGQPAVVFGDDGISRFPSSVTSGTSVSDTSGRLYAFAPGRYQFPRVAAGSYRLAVVPPLAYAFASVVATPVLQALPGAPFFIVSGSRGETFPLLPGAPVYFDVPLDPLPVPGLQLTKTAAKAAVAIGEFAPYTISIVNPAPLAVPNVQIADRLPLGFRYQAGSARLDSTVLADPRSSSDGRSLEFSIGTLAGSASVSLRYVAAVFAGAKVGVAENTAQAFGSARSNMARASVLVREDLNRSRAILVGRVTVADSCAIDGLDDQQENQNGPGSSVGLKDVRVMLQDGTYLVTDTEGRWHADNIRPGTHVVQLDETSLPKGVQLEVCDQNTRSGGRSFSQFVNVRGGTLWRADFRLRKVAGCMTTDTAKCLPNAVPAPALPAATDRPAQLSPLPLAKPTAAVQLIEILPYDEAWLAAAAPGVEWLHPQENFQPALPVVKIAVKHDPAHRAEIKVNGETVNAMRFEGSTKNAAGTVAMSLWRSVDIREGSNLLELTVLDAKGDIVKQEQRKLHYGGTAVKALFHEKRSVLVADGKSRPVFAVRFLDIDGQPVRRGVSGEFQINAPYLAQSVLDGIQREPLAGNLGGKPKFSVLDDGVALIELQPTTQTGEVVLGFDFGNGRTQQLRAWLQPDLRDWVLVGFAEGTLGHKRLSGNLESLQAAGADEQLFDQNRVAFYGKGRIKGEYLLTIAYDTAKEKNAVGSKVLKQAIDPNRYYTLYADATEPRFDAASASKLYLKIERSQFYAMFGDYDTGLSVTELGRYSRTLNGFKSEYQGERFSYKAFASVTAQSFRKDEIQGDGTSGLYRLASRDIVVNSDKVRVEVRDRLRPEIIVSSKTYTRYLDYQIDHALGTLFFREPIPSRDADFNPVFIVADYEAESQADAKLSYGGRIALKLGDQPGDKSEVGLSHIHEGSLGREATLTAADATLLLGDRSKLRAEVGSSQRNAAAGKESGSAYLLELSHEAGGLSARAYARQQDAGFGLGQQAGSEAGTRKLGADVRLKLSDSMQIQAEAYRQQNQVNQAQRDVAEARGQWKSEGLTTQAGLRTAQESDGKGKEASVRQLIGGVAYEVPDTALTLRMTTELDVGSQGESVAFPNRVTLGVDYKLNPQLTLFAQQEFVRSGELKADTTRVGLRMQPWSGGELAASLGNQASLDGERLYGNLGLVQKWQINQQWNTDFGIDRSHTFSGVASNPFNAAQPLASGTAASAAPGIVTGDYTALFVGGAYKNQDWSSNARIEWRDSDSDTKLNLLLGAQRNLHEGRTMAAGLSYSLVKGSTDSRKLDARLSYAHRPLNTRWIWLDRLEYVQESTQNAVADRLLTRKLINNFNANWMPQRDTQIALQYGAKYVLDSIDSAAYKGFTDLIGIEARHDLDKHLDIGLHTGMLRSWRTGARDYQFGLSVGFKLADNAWLSVGYNQLGFVDPDFTGAAYRARGVYLNLRVKFDQDTFNLNDRSGDQLPLKL